MTRIPYVECAKDGDRSQLDLCKEKGVQVVPTWSIGGQLYPGDQELDELETIVASTTGNNKKEAVASTTTTVASEESTTTAAPETEAVVTPSAPQPPPPPQEEKKLLLPPAKPAPPAIVATSSEQAVALATQLEQLDAKLYGAYFCPHSKAQRDDFGREAFAKIPYLECTADGQDSQLELCKEKGIRSVPTWEINGKLFVGQRTLEQMQQIVNEELTLIREAIEEEEEVENDLEVIIQQD